MAVMNDIARLKTIPIKKFFTLKKLFGTSQSAIKIITPLITNKNSPKLKIVTGIVKINSKGFTKRFSIASIAANSMATQTFATSTPGKIIPAVKTAREVTKNFMSCFSFI